MSIIAIVPARYGSTRLPGKALLSKTGKPLIRHVVESISTAKLVDEVVIATDDQRIINAAGEFGAKAVLTGSDCRTGTDRIAQAAKILALDDTDIVVNVQADEPEMPGRCVDRCVELLSSGHWHIATLCTKITPAEAELPNMTKVVFAKDGTAMYFSRACIPFDRDHNQPVQHYLHHGIYAYHVGFIKLFAKLDSTPAEEAEKLEQLRAIEHGYKIIVGVTDYRGARIDTPQEYEEFAKRVAPSR
ncbi:MAG: 3-deoxy-manno-octulosonate cytidylyltransferase [Planctomycetes bacterium]|jgi:3-deoxy-manno-octulosonate cytidylyltransferase (CMP-KDO synthetase)|nr:3-deoxy-manno-octulosonate cytidylyltransferase [Planctomycetota bacterium]